jgi:hypothetical protein
MDLDPTGLDLALCDWIVWAVRDDELECRIHVCRWDSPVARLTKHQIGDADP